MAFSLYCRKWTLFFIIIVNIIVILLVSLVHIWAYDTLIQGEKDRVEELKKKSGITLPIFQQAQTELDDLLVNRKIALIVYGVIVGIVHVIALISTLKSNHYLVIIYSIIMVVSAIINVVAGVKWARAFFLQMTANISAIPWSIFLAVEIIRIKKMQAGNQVQMRMIFA